MKINGFISTVMLTVLLIATLEGITHAENEQDWIPDPNLRQAVREKLEFPDGIPMLPADMTELYDLVTEGDIESLKGLEHAINLKFLHLGRAEVSDLTPLTRLENLRVLKLFNNRISDITPLAGLINLEVLQLQTNQIVDILPLAGLVKLRSLNLQDNLLTDISPLQALVNLKTLHLGSNSILDFTPIYELEIELSLGDQSLSMDPEVLEILNPVDLPVICDFIRPTYVLPVKERILNRDYPSVFLTHKRNNFDEDPDSFDQLTRYDFSFMFEPLHPLVRARTVDFPYFGGRVRVDYTQNLMQVHKDVIRENPNMIFIVEIAYFDGRRFNIPEDSPYWFRNLDGTIAHRPGPFDAQGNKKWQDEPLLNFTNPDVIEMIIQHTIAVAKCGLYDGIWLDRWQELEGDFRGKLSHLVTKEDELNARLQILQGIRANVPDDFLIMVNSRQELPHSAPYINGVFIEAGAPKQIYTYKDLYHFEETIKWYESNLREPTFTLLWGQVDHKPPTSQQTVRQFTTLSLTHSDGYVNVSSGAPDNRTLWYDFWDAPLGRPIGGEETKGQLYRGRDGVFIREFTNGWVVYNRSGTAQEIELPQEVSGWSSGVENRRLHTLPDLDGEIYLKVPVVVADVNGDGTVNILDLVSVANAFGETTPDLNGDGTVNVLDLVLVANSF